MSVGGLGFRTHKELSANNKVPLVFGPYFCDENRSDLASVHWNEFLALSVDEKSLTNLLSNTKMEKHKQKKTVINRSSKDSICTQSQFTPFVESVGILLWTKLLSRSVAVANQDRDF